jgi:hypothetical protein
VVDSRFGRCFSRHDAARVASKDATNSEASFCHPISSLSLSKNDVEYGERIYLKNLINLFFTKHGALLIKQYQCKEFPG